MPTPQQPNNPTTQQPANPERQSFWFLVLLTAFICFAILQTTWLFLDNRSLAEERHYFAAAQLAHQIRGTAVGHRYPDQETYNQYPPLLAYWTAPALAVFGCRSDVALLALLPFAWLLMWSTWKTARTFVTPAPALAAAVLVLCFHHFTDIEPFMAPYSFIKEYMLDLPLSALLALSAFLLITCLRETSLAPRLWLGIALGAGALTKTSFPVYVGILGGALFLGGFRERKAWRRILIPMALAIGIALPWYLLHSSDLLHFLSRHEWNTDVTLRDGLPGVTSLENFPYYLVAAGNMMSLPLALVVVAAAIAGIRSRTKVWLVGVMGTAIAYVVLTLLIGKSWRFLAPCMIFPCLLVGAALDRIQSSKLRRTAVTAVLLAAAVRILIQHGVLSVPGAAPLPPGSELTPGSYNWQVEQILAEIEPLRDKRLITQISVVPVLRRFRYGAFMQHAIEHDQLLLRQSAWRLLDDAWEKELEYTEFIITKDGDNGPPTLTSNRKAVDAWISERLGRTVHLLNSFRLPDDTLAHLYRHEREDPLAGHLLAMPADTTVAEFDKSIRLAACQVTPGARHIELACDWFTMQTPETEYRLFVQLRRGVRNEANGSFSPLDGLYPITLWPPDHTFTETYRLDLPEDLEPGTYELWLGWYHGAKRLTVTSTSLEKLLNAVQIGQIKH